mgnify:CR=1 FL=1
MQQWARQPIFWSVMMIILGFTFLTPLQIITIHVAMVPIVVLVVSSPTLAHAAGYFIVPALLLLFLSGTAWPFTAIIQAIILVPGAVMGYMYRKRSSAWATLTAGAVSMIAVLLTILVSVTLAGIDIPAEIRALIQGQFDLFEQITGTTVITNDALEALISVAVSLLPLYIMIIALYYTVVTHFFSRRLLNRLGYPAAALPPAREWRLPRSLVWYYLAVLLLDLFVTADNFLYTLVLNVYPLLLMTFTVQGVAFIIYWMHIRGRGKVLPAFIGILCILFPPVMYITSMVGLVDTAFPVRQYLSRRK